jgi:hypothetical protein
MKKRNEPLEMSLLKMKYMPLHFKETLLSLMKYPAGQLQNQSKGFTNNGWVQ